MFGAIFHGGFRREPPPARGPFGHPQATVLRSAREQPHRPIRKGSLHGLALRGTEVASIDGAVSVESRGVENEGGCVVLPFGTANEELVR